MLNFCDFIPVFVFTTITTLNYMRNFGFFFFFSNHKVAFQLHDDNALCDR